MQLGTRTIGDGFPLYVICEAGVTNFGSMDLARRQVDAAVAAGCDAVKFQAWRTENLVSREVSQRLEGTFGFNWFDRMKGRELSFDQLRELQQYSADRGITFFATPHDLDALDFLVDDLDVPVLKVGSGEAGNRQFLERVAATGKPIMISFGMQTPAEIEEGLAVLAGGGAPSVAVFHCVSVYPTPAAVADLPRLETMRRHGVPVGISDHSVGWHLVLAAAAMGARLVEKHLTFDKADPRSVDNPGAVLPEELALMVQQLREIEAAMVPVSDEHRARAVAPTRRWATQSIVARVDLPAGATVSGDVIAFKRPGDGGLDASRVGEVLGRTTRVFIGRDQQILAEHLQ